MPPRARYQPPPPSSDPLLTAYEVMARLRCSRRSLRCYVAQRLLAPPIRLSITKCLWRTSDIQTFLDTRRGDSAA